MKFFLACLSLCLLSRCGTVEKVENPVSIASSFPYQVNHFQSGEMLGEGETQARFMLSKSDGRRIQADSLLRENYQTLPLQFRNENHWTLGIGFEGGLANWLNVGTELYLSFADSL